MLENTEWAIKKWTIQRYWQLWVHKTEGRTNKTKNTQSSVRIQIQIM